MAAHHRRHARKPRDFVYFLPKASLPAPDLTPWVLLALIAPFSFAFCAVYIARYRPMHHDTLTLTAGMLIASSLLLIPIVLSTHNLYFSHWPFNLADWVIVLEIILSSIGYLLFFELIKIAGPVYYSLVDTIVVLTGLFWGRIIFNEHLNQWTGSAVCLIILALLLMTRKRIKST